MPGQVLYFAYGSNLDEGQMRRRCPDAAPAFIARLADHELRFAGHSRTWNGGVATVAQKLGSIVAGLVYHIGEDDLVRLDRHEGHPHVYRRESVLVVDADDQQHVAWTYRRPDGEPATQPSPAYLAVLIRSYTYLGFDTSVLPATPHTTD